METGSRWVLPFTSLWRLLRPADMPAHANTHSSLQHPRAECTAASMLRESQSWGEITGVTVDWFYIAAFLQAPNAGKQYKIPHPLPLFSRIKGANHQDWTRGMKKNERLKNIKAETRYFSSALVHVLWKCGWCVPSGTLRISVSHDGTPFFVITVPKSKSEFVRHINTRSEEEVHQQQLDRREHMQGMLGLGLSWTEVFLAGLEVKGKDVSQSCRSKVSLATSLIIHSHYSDKHGVSAVW